MFYDANPLIILMWIKKHICLVSAIKFRTSFAIDALAKQTSYPGNKMIVETLCNRCLRFVIVVFPDHFHLLFMFTLWERLIFKF